MKLVLEKSGALKPIDRNGRTPTLDVPLAYRGESRANLTVQITRPDCETAPVWTLTVPKYWIEHAFGQAFYFESAAVTEAQADDERSQPGSVARADARDGGYSPHFQAFYWTIKRQSSLLVAAVPIFERLLRERLPAFVQGLLESAVQEVRANEERKVGLPIPWSERPIPLPRRRGGQPGNALAFYLQVRARQLSTGESLLRIFTGSRSDTRARARFYKGRRIYNYLRSLG